MSDITELEGYDDVLKITGSESLANQIIICSLITGEDWLTIAKEKGIVS